MNAAELVGEALLRRGHAAATDSAVCTVPLATIVSPT